MGWNKNAYDRERRRGEKRGRNKWEHERQERRSKPSKDWEPDEVIGYDGEPDPPTVKVLFEVILHVSDKGAKFVIADEEMWLPKSHIVYADDGVIEVTEWLARKCGWM